jgi:hypothetical protein
LLASFSSLNAVAARNDGCTPLRFASRMSINTSALALGGKSRSTVGCGVVQPANVYASMNAGSTRNP